MTPTVSVIVTTYNRPDALEAVVRSLFEQDHQPLELIVADDGSGPETAAMVERLRGEAPFPLKHVWQEDKGFRPARARNLAGLAAEGDYLIFTDGDCLVRPDFVRRHLDLAEPGWFVAGKRSYLSEGLTRRILDHKQPAHRWGTLRWLGQAVLARCNRGPQFIALPLSETRRKNKPDQWEKVQTCNLGVWRADMQAVDGFDERYEGHGLEDSDFVFRLIRAGIKRKAGDHAALVLHLWHPRQTSGSGNNGNASLFAGTMAETERTRAGIGLSAHS